MKRGSIFETDGIPRMSEALPRRSSFPEQFQADSPEKTRLS